MTASNLIFSIVGGILPAFFWLWFWLKEDRLHPEPRRLLILTFLAGMAMVALALPLEQIAHYVVKQINPSFAYSSFLMLFIWAFVEEFCKYLAAKKTALSKRECDEPIDSLIYLITAALGFAALENIIFLAEVVTHYDITQGIITGNLRFAGATLIHVLSSACVGGAIAFSFFHKENRTRNLFWGFFFGTLLHTFFNYFIIKSEGENIFQVFLPFWVLIIFLLLIFEKVKKIKELKRL